MAYEKVPGNVAAELTLDEEPILNNIESLGWLALLGERSEVQRDAIEATLAYLRSRIARGVPNEGQPLPAPYIRLPLDK